MRIGQRQQSKGKNRANHTPFLGRTLEYPDLAPVGKGHRSRLEQWLEPCLCVCVFSVVYKNWWLAVQRASGVQSFWLEVAHLLASRVEAKQEGCEVSECLCAKSQHVLIVLSDSSDGNRLVGCCESINRTLVQKATLSSERVHAS